MAKHQRFPLVLIAPLTSTPLSGPLYPMLTPSTGSGLKVSSYLLLDQLRSVDKQRVVRLLGRVSAADLGTIDKALRALLGL